MEDKRNALAGERSTVERDDPREQLRSELVRRGLPDRIVATLTERLAPTVAKLPAEEAAAVLDSVVAASRERAEVIPTGGVLPDDIADIERLMSGFREEVQKLDEGLRVLSAYVSRLRKRGAEPVDGTLH